MKKYKKEVVIGYSEVMGRYVFFSKVYFPILRRFEYMRDENMPDFATYKEAKDWIEDCGVYQSEIIDKNSVNLPHNALFGVDDE